MTQITALSSRSSPGSTGQTAATADDLTITVILNGGLVSDARVPKGWEDRITVRVEDEDTEGADLEDVVHDNGRTYTWSEAASPPESQAGRPDAITVTVMLNGGLVSDVALPQGYEDRITVRVEDEDTEGADPDEVEQDEDGRTYTWALWP